MPRLNAAKDSADRRQKQAEARRPKRPTPPALGEPNLEGLRVYQTEGVRFLRSRESALLADEMRLGKTCQVLRAMEPPCIVLCPASVKYVWRDECLRWRPDCNPIVAAPGEFLLPAGHRTVAISSYDALPGVEDVSEGEWLVRFNLSNVILVLDECHLVKGKTALRTQRTQALANQCGRVWGVTGTPLVGHPPDLWGVLTSCRCERDAFGSYTAFVDAFHGQKRMLAALRNADGSEGKPRWFVEWPEKEPDAAARAAVARVMLRRLRKEVFAELPPKTYQDIEIQVSHALRGDLDKAGALWPDEAELPEFKDFSKVRHDLAVSRIPALLEHVSTFEETWEADVPFTERVPVVVFSAHREPVLELGQRPGWTAITGDMSAEMRRALIATFQGGLVHGIALTIGAGGVGIDLSRASHVVFVDRSFTPADNAQAEDRVLNVMQTDKQIHIDRFVSDHPVDRRLQRILDVKQGRIEAVVGA